MLWKQFTHLEHFPPELETRFNSFLTTEFDDSLSVEMQFRSIIKWCQDNFKTVDVLIDFINDISNWLKQFETTFGDKLGDKVIEVLSEWQQSGYINVVIAEAIEWELDEFKVTTEQNFISVDNQLHDFENQLDLINTGINDLEEKDIAIENGLQDLQQTINDVIVEVDENSTNITELDGKTKQIYMLSNLGVLANTNIDDSLKSVIDTVPSGSTLLFDQNETYRISKPIEINKNLHLDFNDSTLEVDFTLNQGSAILFSGKEKSLKNLTVNYTEGGQSITLENATGVNVGDVVLISSQELFNDSRTYQRKGGTFEITNVTGNQIRIHRDMPFSMQSTTTTANIFEAVTGSIKNVTILNKGELNAGTFGIRVEKSKNFLIENVKIDNFNHLILLRTHINTTVNHFNGGKSYFEGSEESYGLTSYMGTGFSLTNSIIRSGRHATSITGIEPSFNTLIQNCSFDNEVSTNPHSFDCHDSNYDLTMINCNTNGAIFAGNCKIVRSRFTNTTGKKLTLSRYNDYSQSNYIFDNCEFKGVEMVVGEWQQNVNATAKKIGTIALLECIVKNMTLNLKGAEINLLTVENTNNVAFILNSDIEQVKINGVRSLGDFNFLAHGSNATRLKNIVIQNSFFAARYRSLFVQDCDTLFIENVSWSVLEGGTATQEVFNLTANYIGLVNCHFPSGYGARCNASPLVEITGGRNLTITGDNVKKVAYV